MDVLSDVLGRLRLKGSIFLHAEFRAPWGMDIPKGNVAILHIMTFGSCWLKRPGQNHSIPLTSGDLVLWPRGDAHCLMHSAQGTATPAEEILAALNPMSEGPLRYGGQGDMTSLFCGAFEYDRSSRHPLLESLPEMIHIKGSDSQEFAWLGNASHLLKNEANSERLGSSAIMDRLSEVIFSQILRVYIQNAPLSVGFLNALKDEILVKALRLIHTKPENKWTLADLAQDCGVSRSALADRFKDTMGDTPINYLTHWRILKAQDLLENSRYSTAQIAEEVGYQSESAFSITFKKITGKGPGLYRREKQKGLK